MRDTRSAMDRRATPPTKDSPRCADCAISCAAMRAPPRGDACRHRTARRSPRACRCKFYPVHHRNCTGSCVPRRAFLQWPDPPLHGRRPPDPRRHRRRTDDGAAVTGSTTVRQPDGCSARQRPHAQGVRHRSRITAVVRAADTTRGPRRTRAPRRRPATRAGSARRGRASSRGIGRSAPGAAAGGSCRDDHPHRAGRRSQVTRGADAGEALR